VTKAVSPEEEDSLTNCRIFATFFQKNLSYIDTVRVELVEHRLVHAGKRQDRGENV
jgi:hypothetical protein